MYGLYYDVKVDYASIPWEEFLTYIPASKKNFKIYHPRWWKHLDHASKKLVKNIKKSKPDPPTPICSQEASDDDNGGDLDENTTSPKSGTTTKPFTFIYSLFGTPSEYVQSSSPAPDSPTSNQPDQPGPSTRTTMVDSFSDHDDDQEGLIVDYEPTNMLTFLYSKVSSRFFDIYLDDYSPFPHKEYQENDDTQEENISSPQPKTSDAENIRNDTDEAPIPTSRTSSRPDP
ncbi:unnamed protein product [Lactuca virosa]|uniref:Uncharacterized protein n=1 Tax=Lactuca virosa TaxID=75947 RepID=A0AAU9LHH6_9ASTR|nr:unnamed protein product [Lactuca virosa]